MTLFIDILPEILLIREHYPDPVAGEEGANSAFSPGVSRVLPWAWQSSEDGLVGSELIDADAGGEISERRNIDARR